MAKIDVKKYVDAIGERTMSVMGPAMSCRPPRRCRICGCTDADCRQCIEKTGEPCYWVGADLCSACCAPCPDGQHEWGGLVVYRDPDFGVAYASARTCLKCHWREGEDWCETRASGGALRLWPPLPEGSPRGQ
jgi:hypothetical protein